MAVAAAQQPVPQALLPQQALEIAAQAAEQVQNARGAAQAAITAASGTAAVLVNALNANEVTPTRARRAADGATSPGRRRREPAMRSPCRGHRRRQARQPARRRDRRHQEHRARAETPRLSADAALPHGAAHRRRGRASVAGRGSTARARKRIRPAAGRNADVPAAPARRRRADHLAQSLAVATSASSRCPCSTRRHRSAAGRAAGRHARRRHALGRDLGQQLVGDEQQRAPRVQTAELRLDPPDLGPLRVSLNLADGVASLFRVGARLGAPGH